VTVMELSGACPPYVSNKLGPEYSGAMKDFIAACMTEDLDTRPSALDLLGHAFIAKALKAQTMLLSNYIPIVRSPEIENDPDVVGNQDDQSLSHGEEERIKRLFKEELKIFEEKVLKELQDENAKLRSLVLSLTTHVLKLQSDVGELKNKRKNKTGLTLKT